jgi:hypothetical protein
VSLKRLLHSQNPSLSRFKKIKRSEVEGAAFWGLRFEIRGAGFRVQGLVFRVQGLGRGIRGFRVTAECLGLSDRRVVWRGDIERSFDGGHDSVLGTWKDELYGANTGVPREQKMLKEHLLKVIYLQVY